MDYKLKKKAVRRFFWFMNERHAIYLRRQRGDKWPWTDDPILQTYRFCNIFRELDTVTIWIRENWREPYADHKNLWFAMAMARQINWPETLEEIGFPKRWNPGRVQRILERRKDRGEKIYTGAYMLTGTLGGTKIEQTVNKILDPLYNDPPAFVYRQYHENNSLLHCWMQFLSRPGFAGFMSYEVVTDLRHTRYLDNASDIMTWANAGPGAMRGINRMVGLDPKPKKQLSVDGYLYFMMELLELSAKHLSKDFPQLELRDIEHTLCEWDKYERARLGQGRPRSRYKRG